ncbi:MAG: hypothetical protein GY694_16970 [Gammaproteobacteria bacterium]|nr:hypothetical protein [Gammaproteobacteria bacterium]
MNKKEIICHECHKPILNKNDLAVVGNLFITYHDECFEKIKHSNIYAFYSGYKSNGIFLWGMLIFLNSAIWTTFYFFDAPINEVIIFSGFISSVIIFFRVMSYMLYERYID